MSAASWQRVGLGYDGARTVEQMDEDLSHLLLAPLAPAKPAPPSGDGILLVY